MHIFKRLYVLLLIPVSLQAFSQQLSPDINLRKFADQSLTIFTKGEKEAFKDLLPSFDQLKLLAEEKGISRLAAFTESKESYEKYMNTQLTKTHDQYTEATGRNNIVWSKFKIDSVSASGSKRYGFNLFLHGNESGNLYKVWLKGVHEPADGEYVLTEGIRVDKKKTQADVDKEEKQAEAYISEIDPVVRALIKTIITANKQEHLSYVGTIEDMRYFARKTKKYNNSSMSEEQFAIEMHEKGLAGAGTAYETSMETFRSNDVAPAELMAVWKEFKVKPERGLYETWVDIYFRNDTNLFHWELNLIRSDTRWLINFAKPIKHVGKDDKGYSVLIDRIDNGEFYRKY